MKRIAFVGTVGAGKTTLFNALQGNYSLARKTQAVEFNEKGDIDTPGEYFSHPRWYHALITTLQDVDTLIYVHAANDTESRLPAGLLDIGANKRHIAAISKTDMPDADVAAVRQLLYGMGFQEPIFELNAHDPQSVEHLVNYLSELSQKEEGQVKKLITANDIRAAHARGEEEISVVLRASIITPEAREVAELLGVAIQECDESAPEPAVPAAEEKTESQRIRETIIAQLPEGQFTESLVAQLMEKVMKEKQSLGMDAMQPSFKAVTGKGGVKVIDGSSVKFGRFDGAEPHRVGLTDLVTEQDGSSMAAGFMQWENAFFPWTLNYDEVDMVLEGELHVRHEGETMVAKAGDVMFIPKGSSIEFGTPSTVRFLYVAWPANWQSL
ncbi:ethanolamine utilization protein EutQ [Klebsiella michiganensis]|uniref:Ethanolamine utilization protein EutQ n=4 Tax=Enterobacteriaceae TaxID=543 RepID=A0A7H4MU85_9ENTR|nr:ethanolamine utilization protein EutQ [Klebsiella michiganensis]